MLDARDAYLAADVMRFGGANQTELWHAFAARGLGTTASSAGADDDQPTPSFALAATTSNATVTFDATAPDDGQRPREREGLRRQVRGGVTPVADTDSRTALRQPAKFVARTYDFVAQAPGYGLYRFTKTFTAGQTVDGDVPAARRTGRPPTKGASASGDGTTPGNLIDDTEGTQWDVRTTAPVAGKQVTVQLGGGAHTISRVHVSAMLRRGPEPLQRAAAFEIWTCNSARTATARPPVHEGLHERRRRVPGRRAAAGRAEPDPADLHAADDERDACAARRRHDQCTGTPAYAGEQDNDPTNSTDCTANSADAGQVIAAELEVFSRGRSTAFRQPPQSDRVDARNLGYPFTSSNPRTSTVFNENEILRASGVFGSGANAHVALFYNDEHAMLLGINPGVTAMTSNPGHATNPSVGDTTADRSVGPPVFPAAS